jgi:sec-independent protein translocase protein TatC
MNSIDTTTPDYIDQFDDNEPKMGFFDHLDILRKHLLRAVGVLGVATIWAFLNKEIIFDKIILAPKNADFITWRAFCAIGRRFGIEGMCIQQFSFELININISGQFVKHITTSMVVGLVVGFPYLLFEIWRFVSPALHQNERKYAVQLIGYGSILFFMGIAFGYFLLAPISLVFLGTYQVSSEVTNQISLESFVSTLTSLVLAVGLVFELPIVAYFLAKVGILKSNFMKKYRRHSVVVNLILAAIITPTSDVGTLLLMAMPLFLLYEISIFVVKSAEKSIKNI